MFIETGKIDFDINTRIYTCIHNREDKIQETMGIFGDENVEEWPDSWFDLEFNNSMITQLIKKHKVEMKNNKYKTNAISNDQKCPFYGAFDITQLTKTIISYFATYTKSNPAFIQDLMQNEDMIKSHFQIIKGSFAYFDNENPKCSKGADFELIEEEIVYNHRECYGGW
jgi:hypothetical protein